MTRTSKIVLLALLVGSLTPVFAEERAAVGPFSLVGDEPHALMLSVGAFDLFHEGAQGTQGTRPMGSAEIRFGRKIYFLSPLLGLAATGGGAFVGYGGLGLDAEVGAWSFLPAVSIGGYRQGGGKELHSTLIFQAALTVARRLGSSGTRLGLTFAHISNGYRHGTDVRLNPGAEMLLLTVLFPLAF